MHDTELGAESARRQADTIRRNDTMRRNDTIRRNDTTILLCTNAQIDGELSAPVAIEKSDACPCVLVIGPVFRMVCC